MCGCVIICIYFICLPSHQEDAKQHDRSTKVKGSQQNAEASSSDVDEKYKIVIDPGHGGEDPGATGASGRYEKDFNLSVSQKIKDRLEEDSQIDVYLTRENDSFLSSESR